MLAQIGGSQFFIDCMEADTPEAMKRGLVGTPGLKPMERKPNGAVIGQGMLFFYDREESLSYYMPPQMLFPIEIIYIGSNYRVSEIYLDCQPGELDPQKPGHYMQFPGIGKWVLEVPVGTCQAMGIEIGTQINLDDDGDDDYSRELGGTC